MDAPDPQRPDSFLCILVSEEVHETSIEQVTRMVENELLRRGLADVETGVCVFDRAE